MVCNQFEDSIENLAVSSNLVPFQVVIKSTPNIGAFIDPPALMADGTILKGLVDDLTMKEQEALLEDIYNQLAQFPIPPPIELSDLPDDVPLSTGLGLHDPAPLLPRFTGVHPEKWLAYAERFFTYYKIHNTDRFPYVSYYFEDEAAIWFSSFQSTEWSKFIESLVHRFGSSWNGQSAYILQSANSDYARQVIDEMSDRIENANDNEVYETIDNEVLDIESVVDVNEKLVVKDAQLAMLDSIFVIDTVRPSISVVWGYALKENVLAWCSTSIFTSELLYLDNDPEPPDLHIQCTTVNKTKMVVPYTSEFHAETLVFFTRSPFVAHPSFHRVVDIIDIVFRKLKWQQAIVEWIIEVSVGYSCSTSADVLLSFPFATTFLGSLADGIRTWYLYIYGNSITIHPFLATDENLITGPTHQSTVKINDQSCANEGDIVDQSDPSSIVAFVVELVSADYYSFHLLMSLGSLPQHLWKGLNKEFAFQVIVWPPLMIIRGKWLKQETNRPWCTQGLLDYFEAWNPHLVSFNYAEKLSLFGFMSTTEDLAFFIMSMCGPCLWDLWYSLDQFWEPIWVAYITDTVLFTLDLLHSKRFAHGDRKPETFVLCLPRLLDEPHLYCLDLFLLLTWTASSFTLHVAYAPRPAIFSGILRYINLHVPLGHTCSKGGTNCAALLHILFRIEVYSWQANQVTIVSRHSFMRLGFEVGTLHLMMSCNLIPYLDSMMILDDDLENINNILKAVCTSLASFSSCNDTNMHSYPYFLPASIHEKSAFKDLVLINWLIFAQVHDFYTSANRSALSYLINARISMVMGLFYYQLFFMNFLYLVELGTICMTRINDVVDCLLPVPIGACTNISSLYCVRGVHVYVVTYGFASTLCVTNFYLTLYSNCGFLEDSRHVCHAMSTPNCVSRHALLHEFSFPVSIDVAFLLCAKMTVKGIEFDPFTRLVLISECHQAGLLEERHPLLYEVVNDDVLLVTLAHYACFINLLGWVGDFASNVSSTMSMEPQPILMHSLVSACPTTGRFNVDVPVTISGGFMKWEPGALLTWVFVGVARTSGIFHLSLLTAKDLNMALALDGNGSAEIKESDQLLTFVEVFQSVLAKLTTKKYSLEGAPLKLLNAQLTRLLQESAIPDEYGPTIIPLLRITGFLVHPNNYDTCVCVSLEPLKKDVITTFSQSRSYRPLLNNKRPIVLPQPLDDGATSLMFTYMLPEDASFLDPNITSFEALYGHKPLNIVCYLLPSMSRASTWENNCNRPYRLFTLHLEDKVNLKGGGNVMNSPILRAQVGNPTQDDGSTQPNVQIYVKKKSVEQARA